MFVCVSSTNFKPSDNGAALVFFVFWARRFLFSNFITRHWFSDSFQPQRVNSILFVFCQIYDINDFKFPERALGYSGKENVLTLVGGHLSRPVGVRGEEWARERPGTVV